ncbi:hypothetical protein [Streptosporangium sp. G12]
MLDFLTPQPAAGSMSFEDELHAALDDPSVPVQQDMAAFASVLESVPVVVDTLHHPDRGRRMLRHAFTAFHRAVLAAGWPRLHAQLAADLTYRARLAAQSRNHTGFPLTTPDTNTTPGEPTAPRAYARHAPLQQTGRAAKGPAQSTDADDAPSRLRRDAFQ